MGATRLTEIMVGVTGIVMPYALATPPQGWLLCDGSPLAAGTADRLRARLVADGNPYGSDGGNPRLPDLRGEFVPEWEAFLVVPAAPMRVFAGVETHYYRFPSEAVWLEHQPEETEA